MKKIGFIAAFVASMLVGFTSCDSEDELPSVSADFDITVEGEAPNATVLITNKSKIADTYEWTFGSGFDKTTSTAKSPSRLKVDKTGELSITLIASNGTDSKTLTKKIDVTGKNAIVTLTDITFDFGSKGEFIFFSSIDSTIYKKSELNATNGSSIDFALLTYSDSSISSFESPHSTNLKDFGIIGAKNTKIMNFQSLFSVEDFDALADDDKFKNMKISHNGDTFSIWQNPQIILFELSDGKKGAIKVKNANSKVTVDIKMMKY